MSAAVSSKARLPAEAEAEPSLKRVRVEPAANGHANGHSAASNDHSSLPMLPSDWPPLIGDIDLKVHDLPHASSKTEWWYVNSHVQSASGKQYSLFASFFRMAVDINADGSYRYTHSLTWAIVDPQSKSYHSDSQLDVDTPRELARQIKQSTWRVDRRINQAMEEVIAKGIVPLPDRLFDRDCEVSAEGSLSLQYGEHTFSVDDNGHYHLHCSNPAKGIDCTLLLKPMKPVQRQAHDGVVKLGLKDEWMCYYFIPRLSVTGTITVDNFTETVNGDAWYDHEFGGDVARADNVSNREAMGVSTMQDAKSKPDHAWNWLSLQLDDGSELTATHLVNTTDSTVVDNYAILIHSDGSQSLDNTMVWTPTKQWISLKTTNDYPTQWSLSLPQLSTELSIECAFERQEFLTLISKPAFYEGRVMVTGTIHGRTVSGLGFIERYGFNQISALDYFFKRMSKLVMQSLNDYIPHAMNEERVHDLMCRVDQPATPYKEYSHLLNGMSRDVFRNTIIEPIRTIADRGGKSWRSYACLLSIDVVGGDSERFKAWLPMPEIMHVGSLIIDDIQDESAVRRGGPACHIQYGVPIAINAGTYAYFLSPRVMLEPLDPPLSAEQKSRLLDIFLFTMRLGHVGQASDIYGMDYMMDEVVKQGDVGSVLQDRIASTHRMKSAVPAGCLARMGAYVGGGTELQMEVLGKYFEAVGLAFQIVDDLLNLKGFVGDTKIRGEDITAGKVTFPVAMAMKPELSTHEQRAKIWSIVKSKPKDIAVIDESISIIEKCQGVKLSQEFADRLVREAWAAMDPHIPDSYYKLMLRAFGFYVLERHY